MQATRIPSGKPFLFRMKPIHPESPTPFPPESIGPGKNKFPTLAGCLMFSNPMASFISLPPSGLVGQGMYLLLLHVIIADAIRWKLSATLDASVRSDHRH
jgi:hypothetical protein